MRRIALPAAVARGLSERRPAAAGAADRDGKRLNMSQWRDAP